MICNSLREVTRFVFGNRDEIVGFNQLKYTVDCAAYI